MYGVQVYGVIEFRLKFWFDPYYCMLTCTIESTVLIGVLPDHVTDGSNIVS